MARPSAARPAARATAALRRSAGALAALAAVALSAPAAHAQPGVHTFDGLTDVDGSGIRYVANCHRDGGLRFTLVDVACGTDAAFATWTSDSPLFYTGSPALFNNLGPSVDFTAVSGRTFSLRSLSLAPSLGALGSSASVLFTGYLAGGGTVTQMADVAGATAAMSPVTFANFRNLTSVRMTVTSATDEPYVQFDNVAASVVPEPATVALLGAGVLGVAALARRRRSA